MTEELRPSPASGHVDVVTGAIVAYRLCDIADSIDLGQAQRLWVAQPGATSARGRLSTAPAKALTFDVPPLVLSMEPVAIDLEAGAVTATASVRVYDFGVASLVLRVPVNNISWEEFCQLANGVGDRLASTSDSPIWPGLLSRLRSVLAPALTRPQTTQLEEDYMVGLVQSSSELLSAGELLERIDLASFLAGEDRRLSDSARTDLLRRTFSYYADDLAVLTWDRAFISEPRGDSDVLDIIEIANAQLLEMRYYDELLDAELPRMYEAIKTARRGPNLFAARRFAGLARRFQTLVAEVTELTEKVDNALQVTEDVYLARIYAAALELFRVRLVNDAVNRKLIIIREAYTALYEEASVSRTELLEILILLLIALEIVLTVVRH